MELFRYDLINYLIKKNNFKTYLEIGYQHGINYSNICIENKTTIDPYPSVTLNNLQMENKIYVDKDINLYLTTSNTFFETFDHKYDIIFIDGLHTYEQVKLDFENSIKSLNENGLIVLHDMNPIDVFHEGRIITGRERSKSFADGGQWNGDCYKLAIDMYNGKYDYEYFTVDIDQGCMIVSKKLRNASKNNIEKSYDALLSNRKSILNLISYTEL